MKSEERVNCFSLTSGTKECTLPYRLLKWRGILVTANLQQFPGEPIILLFWQIAGKQFKTEVTKPTIKLTCRFTDMSGEAATESMEKFMWLEWVISKSKI